MFNCTCHLHLPYELGRCTCKFHLPVAPCICTGNLHLSASPARSNSQFHLLLSPVIGICQLHLSVSLPHFPAQESILFMCLLFKKQTDAANFCKKELSPINKHTLTTHKSRHPHGNFEMLSCLTNWTCVDLFYLIKT